MLAILSDTHGTVDHRLEGRTLRAVREAELVVHAGDFTTAAVYEAFEREADALVAVVGNNDDEDLRGRLPAVATAEWNGLTVLVVHGHEHTETALSLLARQEDADLVVVGHSHRPGLGDLSGRVLINPGSHADPRQFQPAHAEVKAADGSVQVVLCRPGGEVVTEVRR